MEEVRVLGDDADERPELLPAHHGEVDAAAEDPAAVRLIDAGEQRAQGTLARAAGPDDRGLLPGPDVQGEVAQVPPLRVVPGRVPATTARRRRVLVGVAHVPPAAPWIASRGGPGILPALSVAEPDAVDEQVRGAPDSGRRGPLTGQRSADGRSGALISDFGVVTSRASPGARRGPGDRTGCTGRGGRGGQVAGIGRQVEQAEDPFDTDAGLQQVRAALRQARDRPVGVQQRGREGDQRADRGASAAHQPAPEPHHRDHRDGGPGRGHQPGDRGNPGAPHGDPFQVVGNGREPCRFVAGTAEQPDVQRTCDAAGVGELGEVRGS